MRGRSHIEHIDRWVRHVKNTPGSEWVKEVKPRIDSQIIRANRF